jgi:DNA modification methylase
MNPASETKAMRGRIPRMAFFVGSPSCFFHKEDNESQANSKHFLKQDDPMARKPKTPLRLEYRDAEELKDNPSNWRKHPAKQLTALRDVIAEVGWAGAVLYNERTKRLIDGHARKEVSAGKIPVLVGNWSEEQEKKILATLDPLGALAEVEYEKLEALLKEVETESDALAQILEDLAVANGIDSILDGEGDADDVPQPPDEPVTQPGDLWILGNHRLLCGDSSKPEDVDRLLNGAPIHLTNTDPPYGVHVEPRSNNAIASGLSSFTGPKHHQRFDVERHPEKSKPTSKKMRAKDRPLANDFLDEEKFNQLLHTWFSNIARVLLPGRAFYLYGGYSNCGNFPPVLKACGLYFSQAIIWIKGHPVLTRKDFLGDHEWAFYGWREGAAHQFFGPNNISDVWEVKKINPQSMVHLTEKPVELAVRAMQYSSRIGENVLDLFGGSGSTLIGAEQTDRKAYLMELDPAYCDVIVQRWEKLTGKKARRKRGRHEK